MFHLGTAHTRTKRSASVNNRRSQSALLGKDKYYNEPQSFTESICQYYNDLTDKSTPTEFGLHRYPIKEMSNQRVKSAGIRQKLPLTKGQQLYLLGKYHVKILEKKVNVFE